MAKFFLNNMERNMHRHHYKLAGRQGNHDQIDRWSFVCSVAWSVYVWMVNGAALFIHCIHIYKYRRNTVGTWTIAINAWGNRAQLIDAFEINLFISGKMDYICQQMSFSLNWQIWIFALKMILSLAYGICVEGKVSRPKVVSSWLWR